MSLAGQDNYYCARRVGRKRLSGSDGQVRIVGNIECPTIFTLKYCACVVRTLQWLSVYVTIHLELIGMLSLSRSLAVP